MWVIRFAPGHPPKNLDHQFLALSLNANFGISLKGNFGGYVNSDGRNEFIGSYVGENHDHSSARSELLRSFLICLEDVQPCSFSRHLKETVCVFSILFGRMNLFFPNSLFF